MIINASGNGVTDGTAHRFLSMLNTDVPILLVSRVEGFVFNEQINTLKGKKYILCDYVENGWEWDSLRDDGHLWGVNTQDFDFMQGDEWKKFDEFIVDNPPAISFIRELKKEDVAPNRLPIEYPNFQPKYALQDKEQFMSRPITLFNFWGRSHEERLQVHGNIWKDASRYGYSVCDNIYFLERFLAEEKGNKYVTIWMPHYFRVPIENILAINQMSKFSLSMPGAGIKCFRSTGEAPANSIMVCKEDGLAWTYPWVHAINCLNFDGTDLSEVLESAKDNEKIYGIYCNGVATANKYRVEPYINNYLLPLINKL